MRAFLARTSRTSGAAALACNRAEYMPVWKDAEAKDALGEERLADELDAIGGRPAVPSLGAAVDKWLAYGNDPLLDALRPGQTSVFHRTEDYVGTNLVDMADRGRLRDSIHFWSAHYDKHYASVIRQFRRGALNHIGVMSAPEVVEDEADKALTGWDRDTQFRELAYLAESILKTPVSNLAKFEQAVRSSTPEAYLELMDAIGQQTQTLIPLPSASVWYYEGDARLAWCKSFKAAQAEALAFFQNVLGPALAGPSGKPDNWTAAAKQIAAVFAAIGAVQQERQQRQVAAGLRKAWAGMTDEEKFSQCYHEQETLARSIAGADFDAEDVEDKSVEWLTEQEKIQGLLEAPLAGFPTVSALQFWKHTVRLDALETDYLLTDHNKRLLSAKAIVALYDLYDGPAVAAKAAESFEKGRIDLGSASFVPAMNDVWCWRHFAKFGLATTVHHTATAKRHLTYNFTDSVKMVAASAKLFYLSRPLSGEINYASPALHRKSFVQLCASYGVDWMHSLQRSLFTDLMALGQAEDAMRTCIAAALVPFHAARRAVTQAELAVHAPTISALTQATVVPYEGESGDMTWALGSKRKVAYTLDSPHIVHLQRNASLDPKEARRNKAALETRGAIEVSLWRKLSPEEVKVAQDRAVALQRDAAKLLHDASPQLTAVQEAARGTAVRLSGLDPFAAEASPIVTPATSDDAWEFVTMLHDRHVLSDQQTLEVALPFRATCPTAAGNLPLVPEGTCRLRLRAFDHDVNPEHLPVHCSDAFTAEFHVFDCIPQVAEELLGSAAPTVFPGKQLVPFFTHLRAINIDAPLALEVTAGQYLTPKGEVFFDKCIELLKSGKHSSPHLVGASAGLTGPQLAAEPNIRSHWALYHPAASEDEWAGVRRAVLDAAFEREKEWWLPDEILSGAKLASINFPPSVRYANDVLQCLSADGTSSARGGKQGLAPPMVRASYSGDGTLAELELNEKRIVGSNASFDDIFSAATAAVDDAHLRLCTLSAAKVTEFRKLSQHFVLLASVSAEFGGKYGRTYRDAYDKAAAEVLEPATAIEEALRDDKKVDRFASSTHPEQRRRVWQRRTNAFGQNMDDPTPDMTSTWGNTL